MRHQRGAALLTAMIIVTLVATLATAMVWQQWRAVQVESAERARAQAAWMLAGALDFAQLILREDATSKNGSRFTALTEPWATPLAEARLSTFLAVDKANAEDGPEAFLSGNITDAQARYNLANLVIPPSGNTPAAPSTAGRQVLTQLCEMVGVESGVANRIADGMLKAMAATPTADAPLLPKTVAQLTWFGVDPASVQALQPYVMLLPTAQPTRTPVNVNTASKEVLAALVNIDPASAERLVQFRQRTPFTDPASFADQIKPATPPPADQYAVRSNYFEVRGRLRLVDRVLIERSLVNRTDPRHIEVLQRERIAGLDQPGG